MNRLEEIEARANAATPPPLRICIAGRSELTPFESMDELQDFMARHVTAYPENLACYLVAVDDGSAHAVTVAITGNGPTSEANANFILHARTDVPFLLSVIRVLAGKCETWAKAAGPNLNREMDAEHFLLEAISEVESGNPA